MAASGNDLDTTIQRLYADRKKLDAIIRELEELATTSIPTAKLLLKRRGRKSMGPAERKTVSERIKKYWAEHRK